VDRPGHLEPPTFIGYVVDLWSRDQIPAAEGDRSSHVSEGQTTMSSRRSLRISGELLERLIVAGIGARGR
jgi:hypothetical protein